jgi:hypothetical protein
METNKQIGIVLFATVILTMIEVALWDFNPWPVTALVIFFVAFLTSAAWTNLLVKQQVMVAFILFVAVAFFLLNPATYQLETILRPGIYGLVAGAAAAYVAYPPG